MSATAALSAAAVADLTTGGPDDVLAFTGVARARDRRRSPSVAGLLRLGFLANFISEPVLKGFIIGLALTIIIGQVPKLFGDREGGRQLLRAAVGRPRRPRRHPRPDARRRRSCRSAVVLALRRFAPVVPGVARGRDPRRRRRRAVRPRRQGRRDRRRDRQRAAAVGLPEGVGSRRLPRRRRRGRRRSCSSASPRASARPRRTPPATTTRSTPTGSCSASARANLGAGLCSGMVVNGSLSKTAVNGVGRRPLADVRARRRRADGRHAAVPHRAVREPARGDAGRRRDRRRHRARRHRRARAALPPVHASGSAGSTARRPGPTSSPPSPRCSACWCSTRCPGSFIGIVVSLLLLLYRVVEAVRGRARPGRRAPRPVRRPRAPPDDHVESRRRRAAGRVRPVLRQRRRRAAGRSSARRRPGTRAWCSTPRRSPSSTSPRCGCSTSSPTTSPRRAAPRHRPRPRPGGRPAGGREVGTLQVYRTIDEAVAAMDGGPSERDRT